MDNIKTKQVESIRISTRPDYINKEKLQLLKKYGVKTIELGVQSTNEETLHAINRYMSQEHLCQVVDEIHSLNNIHQH